MKKHTKNKSKKFRVGCHKLLVGTGRYDIILLSERICSLRSGSKIADETYLLLEMFLDERHILIQTGTKTNNLLRLSHENLISQLMNSDDCCFSL